MGKAKNSKGTPSKDTGAKILIMMWITKTAMIQVIQVILQHRIKPMTRKANREVKASLFAFKNNT